MMTAVEKDFPDFSHLEISLDCFSALLSLSYCCAVVVVVVVVVAFELIELEPKSPAKDLPVCLHSKPVCLHSKPV